MKKSYIIIIILVFLFGVIIGHLIPQNKKNKEKETKEETSLLDYQLDFVGEWEYGKSLEEIKICMDKQIEDSKKYGENCKNMSSGMCTYEGNNKLLIDKDGNVEMTTTYMYTDEECKPYYTGSTKKGTLENSTIVFKEIRNLSNENTIETRELHNITTYGKDTLQYQLFETVDKKYLFKKR